MCNAFSATLEGWSAKLKKARDERFIIPSGGPRRGGHSSRFVPKFERDSNSTNPFFFFSFLSPRVRPFCHHHSRPFTRGWILWRSINYPRHAWTIQKRGKFRANFFSICQNNEQRRIDLFESVLHIDLVATLEFFECQNKWHVFAQKTDQAIFFLFVYWFKKWHERQ